MTGKVNGVAADAPLSVHMQLVRHDERIKAIEGDVADARREISDFRKAQTATLVFVIVTLLSVLSGILLPAVQKALKG